MRKVLLIPLILVFSSVYAVPEISELVFNPDQDLWLGEQLNISLICLEDNPNATVENVYLNVTGSDGFFIPNWNMNKDSGHYYQEIDSLNKIGNYEVNIYCENNLTQIQNENHQIEVSEFTVDLVEMNPNPAYLGDEIEVGVVTKVNGESVRYSDISFDVEVGSIKETFDQTNPPRYVEGMWKMDLILPESMGTHDVSVDANYGRTTAYSEDQIEIKSPLQFELAEIDSPWIKQGDNITLTFQTSYKGVPFDLSDNNLKIKIDGYDCDITDTSRAGTYSYVDIDTPDLSPGKYGLKVELTYQDFRKTIQENVNYVVPVIGEMLKPDNSKVSATIEFKNREITKSVRTDGGGKYSSEIPIGTYDINLDFPRSNLLLEDVEINDFENPIRYDEIGSGFDLEGIGVNGIFVYEVALDYDDAHLEMRYDDSSVPDEERISVYRCQKWNFGARECNDDWEEITAEIDTIRNEVSIDTISLSAFLIGYKKEMVLDSNIEKDNYYLEDIVKVLGIVEDENQNAIEGVVVTGKIMGTDIEFSAQTDSGGVFTKEFQGPSTEGKHELVLTAEKNPYDIVEQTLELEMIRSKKLTLTVPSSLKLEKGDGLRTEFLLNNIGQTDFKDLTIYVEGLSEDYYILSSNRISEIKAGGEKRVAVTFNTTDSSNAGSYTGTVRVRGDDVDLSEEFILNIQEKKQEDGVDEEDSGFNFPSAKIIIPGFSWEALSVSLFGIFSIGGAIFYKKKRTGSGKTREDVKSTLMNIRREIEKDTDISKNEKDKDSKPGSDVNYAS